MVLLISPLIRSLIPPSFQDVMIPDFRPDTLPWVSQPRDLGAESLGCVASSRNVKYGNNYFLDKSCKNACRNRRIKLNFRISEPTNDDVTRETLRIHGTPMNEVSTVPDINDRSPTPAIPPTNGNLHQPSALTFQQFPELRVIGLLWRQRLLSDRGESTLRFEQPARLKPKDFAFPEHRKQGG